MAVAPGNNKILAAMWRSRSFVWKISWCQRLLNMPVKLPTPISAPFSEWSFILIIKPQISFNFFKSVGVTDYDFSIPCIGLDFIIKLSSTKPSKSKICTDMCMTCGVVTNGYAIVLGVLYCLLQVLSFRKSTGFLEQLCFPFQCLFFLHFYRFNPT